MELRGLLRVAGLEIGSSLILVIFWNHRQKRIVFVDNLFKRNT